MLTADQKALIQELSMNPTWGSLLQTIDANFRRDFRYKPSDEPEAEKNANWAYASGMDRRLEDVLKLLGYERQSQAR